MIRSPGKSPGKSPTGGGGVWKGLSFYFSQDLLPPELLSDDDPHAPNKATKEKARQASKETADGEEEGEGREEERKITLAEFERWQQGIVGLGGRVGSNFAKDRRNGVCVFRRFSGAEFERYRRERRRILGLPYFEGALR